MRLGLARFVLAFALSFLGARVRFRFLTLALVPFLAVVFLQDAHT